MPLWDPMTGRWYYPPQPQPRRGGVVVLPAGQTDVSVPSGLPMGTIAIPGSSLSGGMVAVMVGGVVVMGLFAWALTRSPPKGTR